MPRKVTSKKPTHKTITVKKTALKAPKFDLKKLKLPKISFKLPENKSKKVWTVVLMVLGSVIALCVIDLFVQYLNNSYSAAIVNSVRIPKNEFNDRLAVSCGSSTISQLIDEELVTQEGTRNKISVKKDEIETEVKKIEDQFGGKEALAKAMEANHISQSVLEKSIRVQLVLQKVIEPTVTYTDEDLKKFFTTNKAQYYATDTKYDDVKEDVKNKYVEVQVSEKSATLIADLKAKANIQNNVDTKPTYGVLKTTVSVVKSLYNMIVNAITKK